MPSSKSTSRCSCGNNVNVSAEDEKEPMVHEISSQEQLPLDASFVHLNLPDASSWNENKTGGVYGDGLGAEDRKANDELFNEGILDTYRHINALLSVAEDHLGLSSGDGQGQGPEGVSEHDHICLSDIERIAAAIDENTERLKEETYAYEAAVEKEKNKQRRLRKALSINAGIEKDGIILHGHDNDAENDSDDDANQDNEIDILVSTMGSLQQEIHHLTSSCQEHEEELHQLQMMLQEQHIISNNVTMQEEEVMMDFHQLELDARAFQEVHAQLTHQCHAAERERYYLSQVKLHSTLHHIVLMDEHGFGDGHGHGHGHGQGHGIGYGYGHSHGHGVMMYPLINNLRLTHRPRSVVPWLEINAAWSQAAQLIMFIGSTTKFKSRDLRIVPLTSCAKIIDVGMRGDRGIVHHLGVDFDAMDRKTHRAEHIIPSIRMFHALLYQMVHHVMTMGWEGDEASVSASTLTSAPLPYSMELHSIGQYDLHKMDDKDDTGWNVAINCIAANLKWLSESASKLS